MIDSCIGADPGETTGLAFLDYHQGILVGKTVLQVDGFSAPGVLRAMLLAYYNHAEVARRVASVEKWVEGPAAGSRGKPAQVTRQLVMELTEGLQVIGYTVKIRPAADVKPWASDKRLVRAKLAGEEQALHGKLRDGWDAARHALYGAWEAGIVQDPLRRHTAAV